MIAGPIRRAAGLAGLLCLTPTAAMLVAGSISPVDAGVRAIVTLVVVRVTAVWATRALAAIVRRPHGARAHRTVDR